MRCMTIRTQRMCTASNTCPCYVPARPPDSLQAAMFDYDAEYKASTVCMRLHPDCDPAPAALPPVARSMCTLKL